MAFRIRKRRPMLGLLLLLALSLVSLSRLSHKALRECNEVTRTVLKEEPLPQLSLPVHSPIHESSGCHTINISQQECETLNFNENVEPQMFPIQLLSGAPGSGNDWLLWLASLSKYTWPRVEQQWECSQYGRLINLTNANISHIQEVNCLFLKSHEPWAVFKNPSRYSVRAALLIRHPYDAAFAEYKRRRVERGVNSSDTKSSVRGVEVADIYNTSSEKLNTTFEGFLGGFINHWKHHANYWLNENSKPLHIILYNSVKTDTAKEVESLQRFFGYNFNGTNLRRHCCVMKNPVNPALLREKTEADSYKEIGFKSLQSNGQMEKLEDALTSVHSWLDAKYPQLKIRVKRG